MQLIVNGAERLKKPGAEVVVSDDLNQIEDILVLQAHLLQGVDILWAAGVGASRDLDGKIGDAPFAHVEIGLCVVNLDLFR